MGLLDGPIPAVELTPEEIEHANREVIDAVFPELADAVEGPPMEYLIKPAPPK